MNLASHYVPFLKSAPPKAIKTLGLGVVLALVIVGPAAALTVDRERVAEAGHRFEVRCGEPQTFPKEVRRQAKPLGTASCLRARPGG